MVGANKTEIQSSKTRRYHIHFSMLRNSNNQHPKIEKTDTPGTNKILSKVYISNGHDASVKRGKFELYGRGEFTNLTIIEKEI